MAKFTNTKLKFSPLQIAADCFAWYDASKARIGSLSAWGDLSGNGNHLAQATGANQPVNTANIQNGLPGVLFSGTTKNIECTFPSFIAAYPSFTTFIALKLTSNTGTAQYPIDDAAIGSGQASSRRILFNCNSSGFFSTNYPPITSSVATDTNPHIIAHRSNISGNSYQYIDGTQTGTGTGIGSAQQGIYGIKLGNRINSTFNFSGYIFEAIVYKRDLTANQISTVSKYLGNKWGITVS